MIQREKAMRPFEDLLKESVAQHGHLCAGQVIGVRMSMLGCKLIGIENPKSDGWRKKIMVFVEIDRCATDAIQSVTGCSMGKRTLKFRDFGINAATFLNLETGEAYRIVSTEESRKLAELYASEEPDLARRQLIGYQQMPDADLFHVQEVNVRLEEWEMPGPARRKTTCERCGQIVRDGREVIQDGIALCRPCSGLGYFEANAPDVDCHLAGGLH
ncbi:formylmethanofuran dehydrogenase subunit E [Desulforhabdus amnigena]|uniref:Formylmethanofuran dehydrogenase subunit E n=2 Tax=Desulforhabdus amnigena TaxID=40218 RepID=A0A9W6CZ95_9BACT|nr:formylmethanofuran dehydrogenase subunit E [Desulforhabdus amnigena]